MGSGLSRDIGTRVVDMILYPLVAIAQRYAAPLAVRASNAVASGDMKPEQRDEVLSQAVASRTEVNDMITGMEEKLAEIEQRQHSVSQQKESLEKDREAVADALKAYRAKVRLDSDLASEEDPLNCDPKYQNLVKQMEEDIPALVESLQTAIEAMQKEKRRFTLKLTNASARRAELDETIRVLREAQPVVGVDGEGGVGGVGGDTPNQMVRDVEFKVVAATETRKAEPPYEDIAPPGFVATGNPNIA